MFRNKKLTDSIILKSLIEDYLKWFSIHQLKKYIFLITSHINPNKFISIHGYLKKKINHQIVFVIL